MMIKTFDVLREKAKEKLSHWLGSVTNDERTVTKVCDGYNCTSCSRYDMEFSTDSIEVALNYLYPEY